MFFIVNVLVPGDFTSQFIMGGEDREALRESLGIDRPVLEQFWTWFTGVLTLDLGVSLSGFPVWLATRGAIATTTFVMAAAMLAAFPLGYWLGRKSAWGRDKWFTAPNTAGAVVLFTAFPPVVAFLLERGITNLTTHHFYDSLVSLDHDRWFASQRGPFGFQPIAGGGPPGGPMTPPEAFWRMLLLSALLFLALLGIRWLLGRIGRSMPLGLFALLLLVGSPIVWWAAGISGQAFDLALSVSLLIVALVAVTYGEILLVTDASMVDTRSEDFILTARAKGLPEHRVRDHHSARAAILPIISRLVVSIPYFFTGLVILEFVFEVEGGMGNLLFNAVQDQDTPMIVGGFAVIGAAVLVLRLVLESAIAVLDPRVRLPGVEAS